jgi:hypothetical protein
MKESGKGLSYWVKIERENGGRISPYMSYIMDRSIYTAAEWALFFGIEMEPLVPIPEMGLTQDMIDAGFQEAKLMLDGLVVKDFKY